MEQNKIILFNWSFLFLISITRKPKYPWNCKSRRFTKNTNTSEELNIQIIAYDAETDMGLAVISTGNATVIGDGVRLRSQPSTSGAILEKMYRGEYVWVKLQSNGWCYLQRLKTGTLGWASADYIRVL